MVTQTIMINNDDTQIIESFLKKYNIIYEKYIHSKINTFYDIDIEVNQLYKLQQMMEQLKYERRLNKIIKKKKSFKFF
jgi:adenylate cyclase class IV